jgi:serine protease AprX
VSRSPGPWTILARLLARSVATLPLLSLVACGSTSPPVSSRAWLPKQTPVIAPALERSLEGQAPGTPVRVWVYFTDKGLLDDTQLESALAAEERALTPRCAWRRAKTMTGRRVSFEDLPVSQTHVQRISASGGRLRQVSRWLNAASIEIAAERVPELAGLDFVRAVTPVAAFKRRPVGTFPLRGESIAPTTAGELDYGDSFAQLQQINVPAAQRLGFIGQGVIVCMMDTGFRKDHLAFQLAYSEHRVLAEWDFVQHDGDTHDGPGDPPGQESHGTSTWSTLGGAVPGQLFGPAYGASFLLAKTEDTGSERPIEEDNWVAGLEWADAHGADVVSSSLGYIDWYTYADLDGQTAVTTRAADTAAARGILVVTAAGNEGPGPGSLIAPADARNVVACGAVDAAGAIAGFSSRGPTFDGRVKPELCARGVSTRCAVSSAIDAFGYASGTSLSTPLVAGAAAVVLSAHPDWTPLQLRQALLTSGSQSHAPDNTYGWGLPDTLLALLSDCRSPSPEIVICTGVPSAARPLGLFAAPPAGLAHSGAPAPLF